MMAQARQQTRQEAVLDIYQLILAAVLFASPWLFVFARGAATADAHTSALLVAAMSGVALLVFREWEAWINVVMGAWVTASPWVLGFAHTRAAHVMIGIGVMIAYLALIELWLVRHPDYYRQSPQGTPRA